MIELTQERVKFLFNYSDGVLIRAVDKHTAKKGDVISGCLTGKGYKDGKGYLSVKVDNKLTPIHRIVFLYHHGYLPEQIDHRNNIHTDNRIENLRACTNAENSLNKPLRPECKSGFKGVFYRKDSRKWTAQVSLSGKRYNLGMFSTAEEANKAAVSKREELHGEFVNHG